MATVQSPPTSVETYSFSYSRTSGKMRFRLGDQSWLCNRFAGKWEILGTDPENGNLNVRCKLRLDGETAYVYVPGDVDVEAYSCDVPQDSRSTHYRLCYNRAAKHWRLRDERTQELLSNDVKDYRGVMAVNYFDGGPHIFHDGPAFIDGRGVAHFAV